VKTGNGEAHKPMYESGIDTYPTNNNKEQRDGMEGGRIERSAGFYNL